MLSLGYFGAGTSLPLRETLAFIFGIVISFTFRGFVKAAITTYMGDDTLQQEGLLTLNPAAHVDAFFTAFIIFVSIALVLLKFTMGSISLVLILFFFLFGMRWRRIVFVDFTNLANPHRDLAVIGVVNVIAGFVFAWLLYLIFKLIVVFNLFSKVGIIAARTLLFETASVSIYFSILDLIPIPMSEGYFILNYLSPETAEKLHSVDPFVMFMIFLVMIFFGILNIIRVLISFICMRLAGL